MIWAVYDGNLPAPEKAANGATERSEAVTGLLEESRRCPPRYGDFRDLGGGRETLVPKGEKLATTDADIADKLASDRVTELEQRRRAKNLLGLEDQAALGTYAQHHLEQKALAGKVTEKTLATAERHLQVAVDYFGKDRLLDTITVADVQGWRNKLAASVLAGSTQRNHLSDLSNLYRRAQSEGVVQPGYNPVAAMMEKPSPRSEEARWLEVHNAALILESARTWTPPRSVRSMRRLQEFAHHLWPALLEVSAY